MSYKINMALLLGIIAVAGCEPPPKKTAPAPVSEQPMQPAPTEQVEAGVGVGVKGRSLDEYEGAVVTPAKSYFAVKERVVFEIQIPRAMQLYEASNDGKAPQSHEEFMQKIVEENQIALPKLPEGHRYVYDPQTKQLMVERPKK
jgi:hypothetical protein